MKRLSALFLIVCASFAQTAPPAAPPKTAAQTPAAPARENGLYMIINTSLGAIVAKLYEKEAPGTVANFTALARGTKSFKDNSGAMVKRPYYTNLLFHRVIPGFMIQTGDQKGDGTGDCGFTIRDEIVPTLRYDKPGVLGVARLEAPNTGACQFFITDAAYPSLNGQYTIFGQVVEGQEIVGKIARVPRDAADKPRTPVKLVSMTIKREGPPPTPPPAPVKKAPATGTATKTTPAAPKTTPAAPKK